MTTWKSHQSSSFIDQSHQSQVPVSRDGCWPNISLSLILTHHHPDHIGMDHSDWAVLLEQGLARWRHRLFPALRVVEHRAHPTDKGEAEAFGKGICRHRQPI